MSRERSDPLTIHPIRGGGNDQNVFVGQVGLAFDRSKAEQLCRRNFFSCKDNTLNM